MALSPSIPSTRDTRKPSVLLTDRLDEECLFSVRHSLRTGSIYVIFRKCLPQQGRSHLQDPLGLMLRRIQGVIIVPAVCRLSAVLPDRGGSESWFLTLI